MYSLSTLNCYLHSLLWSKIWNDPSLEYGFSYYPQLLIKQCVRQSYAVMFSHLLLIRLKETLSTTKLIWESSRFSSIKPKHDMSIYFFVCSSLNLLVLCLKLFWTSKQVNSGKNTKANTQLFAMFWLNWRKYGSVWYSLSCTYDIFVLYSILVCN